MILPVRRPSSPPNPRGISTFQRSFLVVRRKHGKERRLRVTERSWRWLAVLPVIAVAACNNDPFGLNTQPSPGNAALALASTAPTLLPSNPPGHAVATVPTNRLSGSSMQPIVVHGNESPIVSGGQGQGASGAEMQDVYINTSTYRPGVFRADDGEGFDWRSARSHEASTASSSGRGMEIFRTYATRVRFSRKGNVTTLIRRLEAQGTKP